MTDYSRMEFNPTVKQKLFVAYPKLKEIVGDIDDKSLRYILLMYDSKSPLRDQYPDMNRRKGFAAQIAGFGEDDPRIDPVAT